MPRCGGSIRALGGARRLMDEKCLHDFSITFRCGTSPYPWLSWCVKMF